MSFKTLKEVYYLKNLENYKINYKKGFKGLKKWTKLI